MGDKTIGLIGVPVEIGASRNGCSLGPETLRCAGIAEEISAQNVSIEDHGDITLPSHHASVTVNGKANFPEKIAAWTKAIDDKGYNVAKSGQFPLFMGGDHSLSAGSVNAMARYAKEQGRELCVLWLDAHADFNTPKTTPTGNMHGMPVAAFCGDENLNFLYSDTEQEIVPHENVYLFGIRSVDSHEKKMIVDRGLKIADMRSIDEMRVFPLVKSILDEIKSKNAMLHVSFDIDFLDPSIAKGIGTPVNGGATFREAHLIMEMLHESGLVTSADITELNPMLDHEGQTAHLAVDLVGSLFGKQIVQRQKTGKLK